MPRLSFLGRLRRQMLPSVRQPPSPPYHGAYFRTPGASTAASPSTSVSVGRSVAHRTLQPPQQFRFRELARATNRPATPGGLVFVTPDNAARGHRLEESRPASAWPISSPISSSSAVATDLLPQTGGGASQGFRQPYLGPTLGGDGINPNPTHFPQPLPHRLPINPSALPGTRLPSANR
jgi:hypothetical protein